MGRGATTFKKRWAFSQAHSYNSKRTLADRLQAFASPFESPAEAAVSRSPDLQTDGLSEADVVKVQSWRVLRRASWIAAFYLCTTDILGPFNAPFVCFLFNYAEAGTLANMPCDTGVSAERLRPRRAIVCLHGRHGVLLWSAAVVAVRQVGQRPFSREEL